MSGPFKLKGWSPFTQKETADLQAKCVEAGGSWKNGKCVFPKKKKPQAAPAPKPPKVRKNPTTGKVEMHTGSKTDPITGEKTETYSAY